MKNPFMFWKHKKKNKDNVLEKCAQSITDLIVEEYRFLKSYTSMLTKISSDEKAKYNSTYEFHIKKMQEIMAECDMKIVEIEGCDYNDGLSIIPLNMEDFNKKDKLIIKQVIEPLIIAPSNGKIIKSGTVILEKKLNIKEEK